MSKIHLKIGFLLLISANIWASEGQERNVITCDAAPVASPNAKGPFTFDHVRPSLVLTSEGKSVPYVNESEIRGTPYSLGECQSHYTFTPKQRFDQADRYDFTWACPDGNNGKLHIDIRYPDFPEDASNRGWFDFVDYSTGLPVVEKFVLTKCH